MKIETLHFQAMPPQDATAKIYLITAKSVVIVPFDFKEIPLSAK